MGLAASTAGFLSLLCCSLYLWCYQAFRNDLDGDLKALVRAELATAGKPLKTHVHLQGAKEIGSSHYDIFGMIVGEQGQVYKVTENLDSSPPVLPTEFRRRALASRETTFATIEHDGQPYRILANPIVVEGRLAVEVFGISQRPMEENLHQLGAGLLLSWVVGIAILGVASSWISRTLMRPLESILQQIEDLTQAGDPHLRLEGNFQEREFSSLKKQTNALLQRLEESLMAQKHFVTDASHELRAPLSNLNLAIEVCLRRERGLEEYREALETCHEETQRLIRLSNRLLTLSKSDEATLALNREVVDLKELIQNCVQRHQSRAVERNLHFQLHLSSHRIALDPMQIGQVLDNLMDNALRHAPGQSAITWATQEGPNGVEVQISNSGPGLSPEQCNQVFERFYRVDSSRQRGTGGSGLGLTIAKSLIEAHGGQIGVRSQPGQDTTFWFRLPY